MQPPSHTTLLVALTAGVASAALGWWRLSTLDATMEWKDTAVRASPEDVLWFGSDEAWRRLAEVPVHSAEVPPTAREFWQQVRACTLSETPSTHDAYPTGRRGGVAPHPFWQIRTVFVADSNTARGD